MIVLRGQILGIIKMTLLFVSETENGLLALFSSAHIQSATGDQGTQDAGWLCYSLGHVCQRYTKDAG